MRPQKSLAVGQTMILALVVLLCSGTTFATAPFEQVLYSFGASGDGYTPQASVVADKAGNLYGTAPWGGTYDDGTVFELTPPAAGRGTWTESILYNFSGGNNDGALPFGGLIIDQQGNLYGTTQAGGSNNTGTVFELSPPAAPGGTWTETVLFIFPADESQGSWPNGKLVFDKAGNLYGTTEYGGSGTGISCPVGGCGTVFELSRPAAGQIAWTPTVLHAFGTAAGDGNVPWSGLTLHAGVIYGTTEEGGTSNAGAIFQLVKKNGTWSENIIYSFSGPDGASVFSGVIADAAGNLYGTARQGGTTGNGVAFELTPPAAGNTSWTESTLYNFTGHFDGDAPYTSLVRDNAGNLYGTASGGGLKNKQTSNNGVVFKLTPPAVGGSAWTETVLHAFSGKGFGDGSFPHSELVFINGMLYGTTLDGGSGVGTVYRVFP